MASGKWEKCLGTLQPPTNESGLGSTCPECGKADCTTLPNGLLRAHQRPTRSRWVVDSNTKLGMTFRPGDDAELLEALAFTLDISRNEVLRRGLHALAAEHGPHIREVMGAFAKLKEQR